MCGIYIEHKFLLSTGTVTNILVHRIQDQPSPVTIVRFVEIFIFPSLANIVRNILCDLLTFSFDLRIIDTKEHTIHHERGAYYDRNRN